MTNVRVKVPDNLFDTCIGRMLDRSNQRRASGAAGAEIQAYLCTHGYHRW